MAFRLKSTLLLIRLDVFPKLLMSIELRFMGSDNSHASLLISMGENPLVIKDRLGHEDVQTTLGTYGHLYPNSNFQVANRLSNVIRFKTGYTN